MEVVHAEPLLVSLKAVFNIIPQNGRFCIYLVQVDDKNSTIILKVVLYKYKHNL
jgi:hypothetical protein